MSNDKFYKLGPKASNFVDPVTGLKISGNKPAKISAKLAGKSKRISEARSNSHIIEIPESEYQTLMGHAVSAEETANAASVEKVAKALTEMTKKELEAEFAKLEPTAAEAKAFSKLSKDEMVKQLTPADGSDDDDDDDDDDDSGSSDDDDDDDDE